MLAAFADRVPYNVVVVRLDEGPHLVANVIDADPEVGMRVAVRFVHIDDGLTLPQFGPAGNR